MAVVRPQRVTTNEYRYVPAFFQHGSKVLTPVHGTGYCSAGTDGVTGFKYKSLASMTKRIYLPSQSIDDSYVVGQKVGVCVDKIAADGTHYWSDGTVTAISATDGYIDVLIDTAISIPYGGDITIDFTAHAQAPALEVIHAHLWQTVDSKSYITAKFSATITDDAGHVYTPASMFGDKLVFATALDKYVPTISGTTKRYFVIDTATAAALVGSYAQTIGVGSAHERVIYDSTQGVTGKYFNAVAPMFWDRLGHADGTTMRIGIAGKYTWFKDRPFCFRIAGESIPAAGQDPKTCMPATVVYVCNPFNVSHTAGSHRFVLAVPGDSNDIKLPVDSNFWAHGEINEDQTAFVCDFRPAIDAEGMPYVKNVGNDAIKDTSNNETVCVYDVADVVYEQFKNCTFDVFRSTPENENETFVGGQTSNDKFLVDIGIPPASLEEVFKYATLDGAASLIEKATYPVMLSKINVIDAVAPNKFTQSVGSWQDAEYFNGKIWYVSGNILKPANALLEFDPVDTIEIPSAVIGVKALANQLFVMAADGVWTVNLKNEVEFLSSIRAKMWSAVGESLYIVDERGQIFNTEFTPIPASDQRRITENPYMVLSLNTAMIQDVADQWNIFDIASAYDMLWVASNMGLWAMESATKAWFKVSNDVFLQLVSFGNDVYGVTGNMTSDGEMQAIDTFTLMNADKGTI